MHALLEYYYLTRDERLRDAIIRTADYALALHEKTPHRGYLKLTPLAFAARHAENTAPYRQALTSMRIECVTDGRINGFRAVYQFVPSNRAHWTGPAAFYLSELAYGWLNDAAYFLGALDAEPPLTPAQEKTLKDLDSRPVQLEPRAPRESWQTEYDVPQFEKFIRN
jgi:hypothetical protein